MQDDRQKPVPAVAGCRIVAYRDGLPPIGDLRQAKVDTLRELQSASGEELSALLPSVLDRAFRGEL
jgi:hypothetical protein